MSISESCVDIPFNTCFSEIRKGMPVTLPVNLNSGYLTTSLCGSQASQIVE